jgi:elongation factor G
MVEAAAETSEELMNKYLEEGELARKTFSPASAQACSNEMIPVFCGTAFKNKGVQAMLDAVVQLLPSPADRPPVKGWTKTSRKSPAPPVTTSRSPRWRSRS